MKIATLLRIELIKTVHRRAFWVALAFLALISGVSLVSDLMQGRRGFAAPFVAPFAWSMTAAESGPMPAFFLALTIVMLVTSEYTWRTARQNVIDGLSKEQFFAAKWLMTIVVTMVFIAVPFAVGTGTAIYGRISGATPTSTTDSTAAVRDSTERAAAMTAREAAADSSRKALAAARTASDSARVLSARRADSSQAALRQALRDVRSQRQRAVYPAPDPAAPLIALDELKVFGGFLLGSVGFAAMAFMLAVLLRSTGGAVGVFFLYFAFLEQLISLMIRRFGSVELANTVTPYLPLNVLRGPINPLAWHPAYLERVNAIAASLGQPPRVVDVDMFKLIGLPLAWIAVFVTVTFVVFRKRDL
jgi:ABC-2 family transporter